MGKRIARHHGSAVSKLFPVNPRGWGGGGPSRVHCVHAGGTATAKATKRSSQFVKTAIEHDKMTLVNHREWPLLLISCTTH